MDDLYAGRWVARVGGKVVAQGGTPDQALAGAKASRRKEKIEVSYVPSERELAFHPVMERIAAALPEGVPAYAAGGVVRDALLGRQAHDLDFVMGGDVLQAARRIADRIGAAYYPLDEERATARIILTEPDGSRIVADFSAFRGEDLEADLRKRDFTVNAMAVNPHNPQELFDPLGGASDLKSKVLRACSGTALEDDPVRVLRGVRIASAFGLRIEAETNRQMRSSAARLKTVSPERIRDELFRILGTPRPAASLNVLDAIGALRVVLPELEGMKGVEQSPPHVSDVYQHTINVVDRLEAVLEVLSPAYHPDLANNLMMGMAVLQLGRFRKQIGEHVEKRLNPDRKIRMLLYLAALYHDSAKPDTKSVEESGRIRFFGHDERGAEVISRRAKRLHLNKDEVNRLRLTVRHHMRPFLLAQTGKGPSGKAIYRFFRAAGEAGVDICLLSMADVLATYGPTLPADHWQRHLEVVNALLSAWWETPEKSVSPPLILNGSELIERFGVEPGPMIGEILSAVREAQAEGKISTKDEALKYAERLFARDQG